MPENPSDALPGGSDSFLEPPAEPVRSAAERLKAARILVVDDEWDVCETIEDLLADEVWEVKSVTRYEDACAALEKGDFDLAVLDIMGVRGLEILERFSGQVRCVMLTGHAVSVETLRQAITGKAMAYVPKDGIAELARYLRIVLSAPPGLDLWQVWLYPRLDYLNLRTHLGPDFDRSAPQLFEDVVMGRSHDKFADVMEHPNGVFEVRHNDPPLNLCSPGVIFAYRKLLARLAEEPRCRAVVQGSALPAGTPKQAVDMLARRPPLRWLPRGAAQTMAAGLLRVLRPNMRHTIFYSGGIPLEAGLDPSLTQAILEFGKDTFLDCFSFPKPLVIVVEGPAVAGGAELALCGHFIVGDANALFWLPEQRLGFIPPAAIPLLIQRVGAQRAYAICAEARPILAPEARRLGLLDRMAKVGQAKRTAVEVAATLADRQAVAGLQLARSLVGFDMRQALERSFAEWQRLIATPVAQANVVKFFEERGRTAAPDRTPPATPRPG